MASDAGTSSRWLLRRGATCALGIQLNPALAVQGWGPPCLLPTAARALVHPSTHCTAHLAVLPGRRNSIRLLNVPPARSAYPVTVCKGVIPILYGDMDTQSKQLTSFSQWVTAKLQTPQPQPAEKTRAGSQSDPSLCGAPSPAPERLKSGQIWGSTSGTTEGY